MLGILNISLPQFFTIASLLFVLSLGWLVLSKDYSNTRNRLFFLITLIFGLWEFCTFKMLSTNSDEEVIFWDRVLYYAVVFLPVIEYHFSLFFTKFTEARRRLLYSGYIVSLLFAFTVPTNYFVNYVFRYPLGVHTRAQIIHHFFIAFFFFYVFTLLYYFIKNYREQGSKIEKYRSIYFLFSFASLNLIAGLAYLPAYGVPVYPIALASPIIFTILITYAMVSYRLMDIKVALRQSSVYVAALVVTLIPAVIFRFAVRAYIPDVAFWADFVILVISIFIFPFLKNFFYRFANKYFFTTLYDPKKLIGDLTNALSTTIDESESYEILVDAMQKAFHSKAIGIMSYDKNANIFILKYNHGFKLQIGDSFRISKRIFDEYILKDNVVVVEELKGGKQADVSQFLATTAKLKIEILAPMTLENKVVGVIILSEKESRDIYNNEDIETIDIIDSQMAISLENALLYSQTKDFNEKLTAEVEGATAELRQANAELKKLDKAKSEFISIASHQLRTPLTVIKGYASMMLDGSFGEMSAPIKENMTKVFDSNERLIGLVEDLLNISRIESGRLKFDFEKAQLDEVVSSVVEELTPSAEAKALKLAYEKKGDLPEMMLDKRKIRQVIMNITDNSIKYTKAGSINITLEFVKNKLRFCIKDTGMGISPSDLPNLFKKFSRGEDTSIVHTEGTGLGLYVGKQMVEAHGGKIWAESEGVGKGSAFCFELPIDFVPPKEEITPLERSGNNSASEIKKVDEKMDLESELKKEINKQETDKKTKQSNPEKQSVQKYEKA
jgi:signal transduction histidine kinase